MAHLDEVKRLTYEAGWMRWGWPEAVGGFGGSTLLRAYLGEAVTSRGFVDPGVYSMVEVLAPTMIDYARPELAATMVPRSEEHTSELQSLMRISYAVFCLKKKITHKKH